VKAVILAGGLGTRISEESHLKPKPMIEIGGKPVLWHIMQIYSHHGINDFVICCGYGRGFSVREILRTVRRVSGVEFPVREEARRPGDPPVLVADATRIREVLGWKPVRDDIDVICESAYRWEKNGRLKP